MILPINKTEIPYRFDFEYKNTLFSFEIFYNVQEDFFSIDLFNEDIPIVYGEKIVYGQILFKSLNDNTLPKILPIDPSGDSDVITYENFQKVVFLQVIDDAI